MSALNEIMSGIFTEDSIKKLVIKIKDWIATNQSAMSLTKIYDDSGKDQDGNPTFNKALFVFDGEPVGLQVSSSGKSIYLKACYGVYVTEKESGANKGDPVPHASGITQVGDSSGKCYLKCSIKTNSTGLTYYSAGVWYALTPLGNVLIGLYTDDVKTVFMDYPVFFGHMTNDTANERLVYAFHLNRGARAVYGEDAVTSNSVSFNMSGGMAYVVGEGNIEPNPSKRTRYRMCLTYLRSGLTDAPDYTLLYAPLFAVLTSKFCRPIQVDDFYAGVFNTKTYPPMMDDISVNGSKYVTISHDGVAIKLV